jgi:RNA 2',3'-cyclic 3'-phosphodiesterase
MRLFLAIDPPENVKQEISNQLIVFKHEYPMFEWKNMENYHITLHFFGDVSDEKSVFQRLKDLLYDAESFYLYSYNADMFTKNKITMFATFRREKKLESIVKKVKDRFYLPEQKIDRYVPHLTFAKYRIPSKQQYFVIKKKLSKLKIDVSFQVKKIYLFESILGGKTPVYKKIHSITLL